MKASCLGLLLVACASAPPRPITPPAPVVTKVPPSPPPTAIAGRIGDEVITIAEVDRALATEDEATQGDAAEQTYRRAAQRKRKLEEMLDDRLLLAVAKQRGIVPGEAEVDAAIASVMEANAFDDAAFDGHLARTGLTRDTYRASVRDQLTLFQLYHRDPYPVGTSTQVRRAALLARHRAGARISIELELPPKPAGLARMIDASRMIGVDDLAALLGRTLPKFTVERLAGEPASATYDSVHFKADGRSEAFDVAYRVWRLAPTGLAERWSELAKLPNVVADKRLGDASLSAMEPGVFGAGFLDRTAGVIVLVTCGDGICQSPRDAFTIAQLARDRLDRLAVTLE